TLGVLLSEESKSPLRRVGSGKRTTFTHSGEQWLDEWMAINAMVHWIPHD
ncbi:GIY-YIG nuclease family protein, partial [Pectobacterium brasiliense]